MDLSALTAPPPPAQAALSGTVEAVVATTPADPSEGVYVLVGASQQQLGPCRWMGPVAPARGAKCVVMAAGNGHFLLLWYESFAFDVEAALRFPVAITTANAPNNSIFRDSADNIIKVKDNGGTVRTLY